MGNGFEEMLNVYKDSVKEIDEKGYSEAFKDTFNTISDKIKKAGYTLKNVEFLDGYFIFATGTNSVVNFEVEECKNWRFGIWFNFDETTSKENITFDIFAQHKDFLDKFKPSASTIVSRDCNIYYDGRYINLIKFIADHPLRAWYRDGNYTDYNYEYISNIKLIMSYIKYKLYMFGKYIFDNSYDKIYLSYIKRNILPLYDYDDEYRAEILDQGDYVSPRYDIICELPKDAEQEVGYFCLEDDVEEYKKAVKFRNFLSKHTPYYWFTPISLGCSYRRRNNEKA